MRVIRGRRNIIESDKGCVVTIGNFDGVHLGHQAILAAVKSQATKDGVDSVSYTHLTLPTICSV